MYQECYDQKQFPFFGASLDQNITNKKYNLERKWITQTILGILWYK